MSEWLWTHRRYALDLIFDVVQRVPVAREERVLLFQDLMNIGFVLLEPDAKQMRAMWEYYRHHFEGDRSRRTFFSKLRDLARAVATERLAGAGLKATKGTIWTSYKGIIRWDDSLMPPEVAPYVTRVATLHPGVLEKFLPRFFVYVSDLSVSRSTFYRAASILLWVGEFGWSAEKHAANLIDLGHIKPSKDRSEVETVKKFIRDLRSKYRKHLEMMRPYKERLAARKGTFQAKS